MSPWLPRKLIQKWQKYDHPFCRRGGENTPLFLFFSRVNIDRHIALVGAAWTWIGCCATSWPALVAWFHAFWQFMTFITNNQFNGNPSVYPFNKVNIVGIHKPRAFLYLVVPYFYAYNSEVGIWNFVVNLWIFEDRSQVCKARYLRK